MPAFLGKRMSAFLDGIESVMDVPRLSLSLKRTGDRRILVEDNQTSTGVLDLARMADGTWVPISYAPAKGEPLHTVLDVDSDLVPRRFRRSAQYASVAFAKEVLRDVQAEVRL